MDILTTETDVIDKLKENERDVGRFGFLRVDELSADKITTGTLGVDTKITISVDGTPRIILGKFD